MKLNKNHHFLLIFAIFLISMMAIVSLLCCLNMKNGYELEYLAVHDVNNDGVDDYLLLVPNYDLGPAYAAQIGYVNGKQVVKTDTAHIAYASYTVIPSTPVPDEYMYGNVSLVVGEFDDKKGYDIKLSKPIDFPVTINYYLYQVFTQKK